MTTIVEGPRTTPAATAAAAEALATLASPPGLPDSRNPLGPHFQLFPWQNFPGILELVVSWKQLFQYRSISLWIFLSFPEGMGM